LQAADSSKSEAELRRKEIETAATQAQTKIETAATQAQAEAATVASYRTIAEQIVEGMRASSGDTGVKRHAENFKQAGAAHEAAALKWLLGAVGSIVLTLILAWVILGYFPLGDDAEFSKALTVQRLIGRVAPIIFATYILFWCARNYRSHKHLQVVNEHREHALRTFETFVNATKDEATKNAVLLEATRCIFAPASSGYLSGEDDPGPSRIVEVMRMASGKSSGEH
jgi:hypothetical protein